MDVEDNEVRVMFGHERPAIESRGCHENLVVGRFGQRGGDYVKIVRIVVDDKDAAFALFEPVERNTVVEHELAQAVKRDASVATGP